MIIASGGQQEAAIWESAQTFLPHCERLSDPGTNCIPRPFVAQANAQPQQCPSPAQLPLPTGMILRSRWRILSWNSRRSSLASEVRILL